MRSATIRQHSGFFAVGPYEDLGTRVDLAGRALGLPAEGQLAAAAGLIWVVGSRSVRVRSCVSEERAFGVACGTAAETGCDVMLGKAVGIVGGRVLYKSLGVAVPADLAQVLADAAAAAEDIIADVFKALPTLNPTTRGGRAMLVRRTADAMVAMASPWEQQAVTAGNKFLKQNWPNMSTGRRDTVIQQAAARIRKVPVRAVKGINGVISVQAPSVMKGGRKAAIERHKFDIGASLTLADERIVQAAQKTTVSWLTNEYGVRADMFERDAVGIVQRGMSQGLGRADIGRRLQQRFGRAVSGRSASYYEVFAASLVDRSRSWSELNAYDDALVTHFIAASVLDEATTDFCRWVDGKTIKVVDAQKVMAAADGPDMTVEAMKLVNPWVRERTVNGERQAFVRTGTPSNREDRALFSIKSSGLGTQRRGIYGDKRGSGNLPAFGIGAPPYHGHCRTTTVADV